MCHGRNLLITSFWWTTYVQLRRTIEILDMDDRDLIPCLRTVSKHAIGAIPHLTDVERLFQDLPTVVQDILHVAAIKASPIVPIDCAYRLRFLLDAPLFVLLSPSADYYPIAPLLQLHCFLHMNPIQILEIFRSDALSHCSVELLATINSLENNLGHSQNRFENLWVVEV